MMVDVSKYCFICGKTKSNHSCVKIDGLWQPLKVFQGWFPEEDYSKFKQCKRFVPCVLKSEWDSEHHSLGLALKELVERRR